MHSLTGHVLRRGIAPILVAATVASLCPAQGAPVPHGVRKGASVEGITEYTLTNGLRVLLFPDASKSTVTINITYMVGSRHEGYGESGMSHLLEHLVFKGSTRHPNIPAELASHGARSNGTTGYDRTNYFETVPATAENIAWALDLEADRMVNSFIARKDLESEFRVVRNEFESSENSPARVLQERVMSAAYLWHGYGRSTIGTRSDIEKVPIDRLKTYYRKYYQPDNAMLVVAGKVDGAKVLAQIAQKFGAIPKPVRSLARGNILYPTYTEEPVQDGEREVSLRRAGDVQVAIAAYHTPPAAHPDFAAVSVLAQILGSAPSGRLYKALVESKKASRSDASAWPLREPGLLMAQVTLRKDQSLDDAKNVLIRTVEAVPATAPTAEEVERAKAALVTAIELTLTNSEQVGLDLSEWASAGDWRLIYIHRDRLKRVTAADVQRVAAAYLKPENRTVGLFHPTETPDRAVVASVDDGAIGALVSNYRGDSTYVAGEAFDPSPNNIDSRTLRSSLPGGMKLALLPKKTRGSTVIARITLRFGDATSLDGRANAARWMGGMLRRGTRSHTRQQINDEFDRLKTQAVFIGSVNSVFASITTTRPNLIPALRLAAEVLREPAFLQSEFDTYKAARLADVESSKNDPRALASNQLLQQLLPYPRSHPLHVWGFNELIADYQSISLDQVKAVYTDLVGASNSDLAVVGDFAADSVSALARGTFDAWTSPQPFARLVQQHFDVPPFSTRIETPDKPNAAWYAGHNLKIRDDSKDYAAVVIGNYILGGGFLNSRFATRIRQKDGISYSVDSDISAQPLDSVGMFQETAIFNPENVLRVQQAFEEELGRVLKDGFTQDEVDKAKQGYLQQREQTRSRDDFVVGFLANQASTGRIMQHDAQHEAYVLALTPSEVHVAIRKYLDPKKLSVVMAGDFKNKPPKVVP